MGNALVCNRVFTAGMTEQARCRAAIPRNFNQAALVDECGSRKHCQLHANTSPLRSWTSVHFSPQAHRADACGARLCA
jgi:hypothetical protein